jgi:hypothetical protein
LPADFQRDKSRPVVTREREVMGGESSSSRMLGASATPMHKPAKPIVSQNFAQSLNNPTHALNDTNINRHHQSSVQVRYQNEEHVHYWILYA